jgi:hypothetical protein
VPPTIFEEFRGQRMVRDLMSIKSAFP